MSDLASETTNHKPLTLEEYIKSVVAFAQQPCPSCGQPFVCRRHSRKPKGFLITDFACAENHITTHTCFVPSSIYEEDDITNP
jgi:hypothetical protein